MMDEIFMERYTRKTDDGKYEITDFTKATEALAKFEDLYKYIRSCEHTIPDELAKLRLAGKEKSFKFREAIGQKIMNTFFFMLMDRLDLK